MKSNVDVLLVKSLLFPIFATTITLKRLNLMLLSI